MAEDLNAELQERFASAAGAELEADVLAELKSTMQLHSIDVQDTLERESRRAHLQTNKRGGATPRNVSSNGDVFGM
jgi:DNA polymerase alpha subunit B